MEEKLQNKIYDYLKRRASALAVRPVAVFIFLAVLAIYGQSLWFGYVNYDDALILDKRWSAFRQLDWTSLRDILLPRGGATYQPLRDLSFALIYRFSGTDPLGYHLFNLTLYLANLLAVYYLFNLLLPYFTALEKKAVSFWAALATLWFAVHPLHVESVAWMVANKELLSGLFYFLSLIYYLKSYADGFRAGSYLLSFSFLVLGLLSKPSVAALPLVLLAFELLRRRPGARSREIILRLLPFLLLVSAAAGYYILNTSAFVGQLLQGSPKVHLLTMASVLAKYLLNLLLPVNLCNSYPPPFFSGDYNWRLLFYLALDILLLAALVLSLKKKEKGFAFAILFFLLNLIPVSGIFPIAIFMADRYLYLSSFGFVLGGILLGIRAAEKFRSPGAPGRAFAWAGACAMLVLALLSVQRCRVWRDAITLWTNAVRTYPNFQYNHYGLANSYAKAGLPDKALEAYFKTNLFKENFSTDYQIARIYDARGDSAEAEKYYRRVLDLYTEELEEAQWEVITHVYRRLGLNEKLALQNVANSRMLREFPERIIAISRDLWDMGYPRKALEVLQGSVDSAPPAAGVRTVLADLLGRMGNLEAALQAARQARSAGEDSPALDLIEADLHFAAREWEPAAVLYESAGRLKLSALQKERLAASYFNSNRLEEALEIFRGLAEADGTQKASHCNNIGVVLEALDSLEAAEKQYRRALVLKADYADAWFNLGNLKRRQGNYPEALACYRRAEKLETSSVAAAEARAALLVDLQRYSEALQVFRGLQALAPGSRAALLGAGNAAWELGKKKEAREFYRLYLERYGAGAAPEIMLQRITIK